MSEVAVLGTALVVALAWSWALLVLVRSHRVAMDRLVESNRSLLQALVMLKDHEAGVLVTQLEALKAETRDGEAEAAPPRHRRI